RQRQDAAAAAALHQRQRAAGERDQRVGADVERQAEAVARGLHEGVRQLFARRVGGAVHDEVEAAVRLVDRLEDGGNLRVVGDVERQQQRIGQGLGELADVFSKTLT